MSPSSGGRKRRPSAQTTRPSTSSNGVVRIAAKPTLVQIIEYPHDPARNTFRAEFYRATDDARTSLRFQDDHVRPGIFGEGHMDKVLSMPTGGEPVA